MSLIALDADDGGRIPESFEDGCVELEGKAPNSIMPAISNGNWPWLIHPEKLLDKTIYVRVDLLQPEYCILKTAI